MDDDSKNPDDDTSRILSNLEDDVRIFLLSRLIGNRIDPGKRAEMMAEGVDMRRLSKPSYISVSSGIDMTDDEHDPTRGCQIGAEGVMVHEDEPIVHLAFKCGDAEHEIHYTSFMPISIIEMALAIESVWHGAVMGPLLEQAVRAGRAVAEPISEGGLTEEDVDRVMKAIARTTHEGADFDFEDEDEDEDDEPEDDDDLIF